GARPQDSETRHHEGQAHRVAYGDVQPVTRDPGAWQSSALEVERISRPTLLRLLKVLDGDVELVVREERVAAPGESRHGSLTGRVLDEDLAPPARSLPIAHDGRSD